MLEFERFIEENDGLVWVGVVDFRDVSLLIMGSLVV